MTTTRERPVNIEDSVCAHCHKAIYRERISSDRAWSDWKTVYVESADTTICTALCDEHECVNASFVHVPFHDRMAELNLEMRELDDPDAGAWSGVL